MGFRAGKAGTRHIGHMSRANCNVGNGGPCRQASRLQACSIRAACPVAAECGVCQFVTATHLDGSRRHKPRVA